MKRDLHPISQEDLMAYLDGELAPAQAATAANHLEHCRECQSVAADLQSVSRHLLEWQVEKPEFSLTPLTAEEPLATRRKSPRIFAQRWAWIAAAAAAVVVIFAIPLLKGPNTHLDEYAKLQSASAPVRRLNFESSAPQPSVIGGVFQNAVPA